MLAQNLALFLHIVAAIVLLSGVIGGNVIGAMARRARDLEHRRGIVALRAPFDRMTTVAVPATVLTGLVTLMLFGYSVTDLWVLATGVVILVIVAIQILFWNRHGPEVQAAFERGDDHAAVRLMRMPRTVMMGRLETGLAFLQVGLMVFRPNWPG